jgi:hypothetical protein
MTLLSQVIPKVGDKFVVDHSQDIYKTIWLVQAVAPTLDILCEDMEGNVELLRRCNHCYAVLISSNDNSSK